MVRKRNKGLFTWVFTSAHQVISTRIRMEPRIGRRFVLVVVLESSHAGDVESISRTGVRLSPEGTQGLSQGF